MTVTVLTVGMAVVDFVMHVNHMPIHPEKYQANDAQIIGGGCGANAAVAIHRLGGQSILAARLGQDAIGDLILTGLRGDGLDCQLVRTFQGCRSSFSSVIIDQAGERQIINFRDPNLPCEPTWISQLDLNVQSVLTDSRWPEGALAAMKWAKDRGIPSIIDAEAPLDQTQAALEIASHIVFSAQGLHDFSGSSDISTGLEIADQSLLGFVAVTDGARGTYWREDGKEVHSPAPSIIPLDTLAAGDVWHGAFALALGEGMPEPRAIQFSNVAASLKCERQGGRMGAPQRLEIDQLMRKLESCN